MLILMRLLRTTFLKEQNYFRLAFPYGNQESKDTVFSSVDYAKLNAAVAMPLIQKKDKRTRSVIVIHKDRIIAEKYDMGFDKDSKILGWSMTKSITSTILYYKKREDYPYY
jgi:CubicO group peptidase (beta-lactamase class C family)